MAKGILNVGGGVVSVDASGNFTVETGLIADGASVFNETGVDVDFRIESDDNANMFFVDGGNDRVGIGIATPSAPLEVEKDQNAATYIVVDNNTSGTGAMAGFRGDADAANFRLRVYSSGYSTTSYNIADSVGLHSFDASGGLALVSDHSTADISFWTNSTQKVTIDGASGYVGIGTTAPSGLLEIEKDQNSSTAMVIDNNTSGTAAIGVLEVSADACTFKVQTYSSGYSTTSFNIADSIGLHAFNASGGLALVSDHSTADVSFWTNSTQKVTIDGASGNVGIGITAPASLLDVRGTVQVGVDGTGHNVTFFGDTAGSSMTWAQSEDALQLTDSSPIKCGDSGDMQIYHDGTDSYIKNSTGVMHVATNVSGIAVSIGHTTSETTVNDNLTVTGTLTGTLATAAQGSVTSLGTLTTLTVDNVIINGTTIGHTSDTDLLTLASAALTLKGTLTVGVDGTGHDVIFYGDTTNKRMTWDQTNDALVFRDSTQLQMGNGNDMTLYHDGTNSYINNQNGILKIATTTSGIAITIGHTTSETTVADNLTVTGTTTFKGSAFHSPLTMSLALGY